MTTGSLFERLNQCAIQHGWLPSNRGAKRTERADLAAAVGASKCSGPEGEECTGEARRSEE